MYDVCVILRLAVSVEHRIVTDGQTDEHTTTADKFTHTSVARVKMILNMNKTEIVFIRPSPLRYHLSSSILDMEVVDCIKYFGVSRVMILVLNYVSHSCLNSALRELTH